MKVIMKKKIIIFNGPPGSGKDTAADYLHNEVFKAEYSKTPPSIRLNMADALKDLTHIIYGVKGPTRQFEYCKDVPQAVFFGLTPRQAYIDVSEKRMKPAYGKTVFGEIFCRAAKQSEAEYIICSDGGFEEEIDSVIDAFGEDSLYLFHVHRPGYDFKNDSRSDVYPDKIKYVIYNHGSLPEFQRQIEDLSLFI